MTEKEDNNVAIEPISRDAEALGLQAEQRVVRKLDMHIMTLIMLIYLFSFLDRVNMGNARLFGLESDLSLVGNQNQILVSILFATYISVELPSNWVIKKIRPSRWIAFITVSWGIIATLSGIAQNFAGMLKELALRIAALFACSALAGATGGLSAFGIGHMDQVAGQSGWRWILIIEGIPTVVLGVAAWFGLADDPATAAYLSNLETEIVLARLGQQTSLTESAKQFHRKDVRDAFLEWKIWLFCFAQFGVDVMLYVSTSSVSLPPESITICGESIPGGAVVSCNPWVIHRRKDVFGDDVEAFRPERWLDDLEKTSESEKTRLREMNAAMLHFGAGSKTCLGKHIALLEIYKLVPSFLRKFDLASTTDEEWALRNAWFVKPLHFDVKITKRNPHDG